MVEDAIKFPQQPEQLKNYDDYLPFFNTLIQKLKLFDSEVEKGTVYNNIINSLVAVFSLSVNQIPSVKNFLVKTDKLRDRIKSHLPVFEEKDSGKQLQAMVEMIKWQK